jgi:hypothetical protein
MHTDSTGNADLNLDLSKRRAEAVKALLVSQFNVDASRLTASGMVATKPIESNDTPQIRAENRRVEFVRTQSVDQCEKLCLQKRGPQLQSHEVHGSVGFSLFWKTAKGSRHAQKKLLALETIFRPKRTSLLSCHVFYRNKALLNCV